MEWLIFFIVVYFLSLLFDKGNSDDKTEYLQTQEKNSHISNSVPRKKLDIIPKNELKITLTPEKYLTGNERKKRQDVINCQTPIWLDIVHEKDNLHDSNALLVFHDRIKIGYITKRGTSAEVDSFAFDKNELKNEIHLLWNGHKFLLTRKDIDTIVQATVVAHDKQEIRIEPGGVYKTLYKNIPPYIEAKGIQRFYHFTDIKNLKSIIENGGLYSWYGLKQKNIISSLSSNELSRELDVRHNLEDYVRLSFDSYHPMSSRLIHKEGKELIWLEIDLDVACWEDTLFSDINATDNNVKVGSSFNFLKTIDLDIFKRKYKDLDPNEKKKYQAEILVKSFLPIKYIKNIDILMGRYT